MGYYTDFELTHDNDTLDNGELATELSELSGYEFDDDLTINDVKWYDWAKDMKVFSARHVGTLFTLSGTGEGAGDIWRAYFKSGKMQVVKASLMFDPYDASKLA